MQEASYMLSFLLSICTLQDLLAHDMADGNSPGSIRRSDTFMCAAW